MNIEDLLQQLANGAITDEDRHAFEERVASLDPGEVRRLMIRLEEYMLRTSTAGAPDLSLLADIHQQRQAERTEDRPVILAWWRQPWTRVAAIFLLVVASLWLFRHSLFPGHSSGPAVVKAQHQDIPPGGDNAVLTLSGGQEILLNQAHPGQLAIQGQTKVIQVGGGCLYYEPMKGRGAASAALQYNSIRTPRGGQYQLVLPDGSRVWLNAESSIRYPTSFSGGDRTVEISGEAYFEVRHEAARPFLVKVADKMEVQVLGTHFNVMAYENEGGPRATLLEGSVKVSAGHTSMLMTPGQQTRLENSQLRLVAYADTSAIIAWKNGLFDFENADLASIFRQLSRWYDVDIVIEQPIPDRKFFAMIRRNSTLQTVLGLLHDNHIGYRIEGRKLIVHPG